jgi:hypothetical protein
MTEDVLPPNDPFPEDMDFILRPEWFQRRLETISRADCSLNAARVALRVLPSLTFILQQNIGNNPVQI